MFNTFFRIYREAGAAAANGATDLPPSLQDIDKVDPKKPDTKPEDKKPDDNKPEDKKPDETGIKSGDGNNKPEDITDKDKKPDNKPEDKKPNEDKKPEDEEEEQPEEDFWGAVEKLTGQPVEVKYPEGVDPISPEGVVLREKAVRDQAVKSYEAWLKDAYPRAYAYFIHHSEGGEDTEFFNNDATSIQLPTKDAMNESVDIQTQVYKMDLKARGIDDEAIEVLVAKAIKDNKLKEKAEASWGTIDTARRTHLQQLEQAQQAAKAKADTDIASMTERIGKVITNDISFVVPEAERPAFQQFITNNMQYDAASGKFYLVQEVKDDNINALMESLLFQHKKGNMEKIIDKRVKTKVAQRLRLQADKSKQGTSSQEDTTNTGRQYIPLSEI